MLISVILPAKNAENTLESAVQSILNQTYAKLELIIIDDNSTDSTADILKTFSDKRIIYLKNSKTGIASALNAGLTMAKGNYIARMDADDFSHPTRLEKQLKYSVENPEIDVISCLVKNSPLNSELQKGNAHYVDWTNTIITPKDHYLNRFVDAVVAHPTVFFKARLLEVYGRYVEENLPEDYELWLRWMQQGVRFAKVPEILLEWSDYPNRTSRINKNYSKPKFNKVRGIYFAKWWNQSGIKRKLWIWGYGKEVFRKSSELLLQGLEIEGYIDIIDRPSSLRNVVSYKKASYSKDNFFLVLIGDRKGKIKIISYLEMNGLKPGDNYLIL